MSNDYNRVILTGRLARDVQEFDKVTKFTLAVGRGKYKGEDKGADFINVVCFGKTAEFAGRFMEKGKAILVEGRLQSGKYEKEGQTHYTTDVIADRLMFLPLNKTDNGNCELFDQKRNGYQIDLDDVSEDVEDGYVPF